MTITEHLTRAARWRSVNMLMAAALLAALFPQVSSAQGSDPYFSFGGLAGEDIGLDDGYSRVGAFVPLIQPQDNLLLFTDTHVLIHDNESDPLGGNFGGGFRYYNGQRNRVCGGYAYYDFRNRELADYDQVGFGLESLGAIFDGRVNVNLPTSTNDKLVATDTFAAPAFGGVAGQNIVLGANSRQQAVRAVDVELGALLVGSETVQIKGYAGSYGLFADGISEWGARGRLELRANDQLWISGFVQDDAVFDTTAGATVEFRFGGGRRGSSYNNVATRMFDPVERRRHIAVRDTRENVLATQGGTPITVLHVDSNAPAAGTGGFMDPVATLAAASNQPQDIVFVHGGSIFNGEAMVVTTDGQRFLGEGIPHVVMSDQGNFLLPGVNPMGATPQIVGAPGNAITLANGNEVSNFVINNSGTSAIFNDGSSAETLLRSLAIDTTGGDAVRLDNQTGDVTIDQVNVANAGATGIRFTGGGSNVTIDDSSIDTTTNAGLLVENFTGDVDVTNTNIDNTAGFGVALNNANTNFTYTGGRIRDSVGVGVVGGSNTAVFATDIDAVGNVDPFGNILLRQTGGSYDFTGSTINITNGSGVVVTQSSANASFGNVVVSGTTGRVFMQANTGFYTFAGIDVTNNSNIAAVTFDDSNAAAVGNVFINNTAGAALFVDNTNLFIGNGSITSTFGSAVSIANSAIDITLFSVTANSANSIPIQVTNTTGNGLAITGNGTTQGSGGLLQLAAFGAPSGISLNSASNVSISLLSIETAPGGLGSGVVAINSVDLVFDRLEIELRRGFDVSNSRNVSITNNTIGRTGAPIDVGINLASNVGSGSLDYDISGNTVQGNVSGGDNGIRVTNNAGPDIDVNIEGNDVDLNYFAGLPIPNGILVEAHGGDVNLTGSNGAGNNTVVAPQTFFASEIGGTVNGQIFVNGAAKP